MAFSFNINPELEYVINTTLVENPSSHRPTDYTNLYKTYSRITHHVSRIFFHASTLTTIHTARLLDTSGGWYPLPYRRAHGLLLQRG